MTIINVDTSYIKVTSAEIAALIATPGSYTKIEVKGTLSCGNEFSQILTNPFVATANLLLLGSDSIRINPAFFGLIALSNGVYKVSVKIFTASTNQFFSNCALVDIDLACKVAALLHNILADYEHNLEEKPSSLAHLLHYSLINGSNCGCNCDDMCKNYNALIDILTNIDPTLLADCGC